MDTTMEHGAADPRKRRFLLVATTALGAVGTGIAAMPYCAKHETQCARLVAWRTGGRRYQQARRRADVDGGMAWQARLDLASHAGDASAARAKRTAARRSGLPGHRPATAVCQEHPSVDQTGDARVDRCLHASWLCPVGTTGRGPGIGARRRLARRIFLSVPRLDVRSGRAGFQERPGTHKPRRAAIPLHQR